MYDLSDDQLAVARRVERVVFSRTGFTSDAVIKHIAHEARLCGAVDFSAVRELRNDWWVLRASIDWLPRGEEGLDTFWRIQPIPGVVNASRGEVFLTALTSAVVTIDDFGRHVVIDNVGRAVETEGIDVPPVGGRVVAFLPSE